MSPSSQRRPPTHRSTNLRRDHPGSPDHPHPPRTVTACPTSRPQSAGSGRRQPDGSSDPQLRGLPDVVQPRRTVPHRSSLPASRLPASDAADATSCRAGLPEFSAGGPGVSPDASGTAASHHDPTNKTPDLYTSQVNGSDQVWTERSSSRGPTRSYETLASLVIKYEPPWPVSVSSLVSTDVEPL